MKKLYFSPSNKSFYDNEINLVIPDDAMEISKNQHQDLLNAINSECIIFNDLTYSEPRPSSFHYWNDESKSWLLDKDKKLKYDIEQNEIKIKSLIDESTLKIDILNDAINFGKSKDGDEDNLMTLRKYRVGLSQIDTNVENMELPEKPKV